MGRGALDDGCPLRGYPRVTLGASAGSTGATEDLLTTPTNRFGIALAIHWQANQSLARARAREVEEQAKRLYVGGKMDFPALLDAQRTLASADDAVAISHARLATDQVAIFLALGGGWE